MAKDPAFLFYSKDWLEGTAELMPDEKGVYIDLLCHQHQKGDLPQETERLARMVGLSHEAFLKVWPVISINFEQSDNRTNNRLVNRKLNRIMTERAEKGRVNTVIGTMAGLLKTGNYDSKQYKYLKSNFIVSDFLKYNKSELKERITEWITERLENIGNGNIDYSYSSLLKKVLSENSIQLPDGFEDLIIEWLKYKSEKNQSYKEIGLKTLIKTFLKDSNSDIDVARKMLDYSMSKNYSGLFKAKVNGKETEAVKVEYGRPDFDINNIR